jgi:hypothetical protein
MLGLHQEELIVERQVHQRESKFRRKKLAVGRWQ